MCASGRVWRQALVLSVVIVLFAGCIGQPAANLTVEVSPDFLDAIEVLHDVQAGHLHPGLHDRASDNMRLRAFHSLADDDVPVVEGNAEVVYHEGYAYVATLGATSGFAIVDVRDPAHPEVVGRYSNPYKYTPDVKVTEDGRFAVLSSEGGPGTGYMPHELDISPVPYPFDMGFQEENEVTGVTLVDITDKANPTYVAKYDAITHNTDVATIDGRFIVFAINDDEVDILEVRETLTGHDMVRLSRIVATEHIVESLQEDLPGRELVDLPRAHDVVYERHPLTGDHLVHVSFGHTGFFIFDVSNPDQPRFVSEWHGLPEDSDFYHYARPADILIDGRHITIVAPEVFNSIGNAGTIGILDTTDPTRPELVGTWTLPGRDLFIERNYTFSPHNFDVADGTIFLASYHAGVWIIDLTCSGCLESPKELGYYLPHEDAGRILEGETHCALYCHHPYVWAAVVGDDGHIYASDVESGLYVIEYDPEYYSES